MTTIKQTQGVLFAGLLCAAVFAGLVGLLVPQISLAQAATLTIGTGSPETIRAAWNNIAVDNGLTTIPTQFHGAGAVADDAATAQAICNFSGYQSVVSRSAVASDGRTGYTSPGDNFLGRWNGSDMQIFPAVQLGNRWLSTLVCGDPTATPTPTPTPTPTTPPVVHQCSDAIDNEGDGFIDKADPDCYDSNGQYDPTNNEDNFNNGNTCVDGKDNDGDNLIDQNDPDCHTDGDAEDGDDTFDPTLPEDGDLPDDDDEDADDDDDNNKDECNDGVDNEGDNFEDASDPDCYDSNGDYDPTNSEDTDNSHNQCIDNKDNEGDDLIDISDPDCHTDNDATDGDDTFDPAAKEDTKNGRVAAAQAPVAVPVTAKTGPGALAALLTLAGGAGLAVARKFS